MPATPATFITDIAGLKVEVIRQVYVPQVPTTAQEMRFVPQRRLLALDCDLARAELVRRPETSVDQHDGPIAHQVARLEADVAALAARAALAA